MKVKWYKDLLERVGWTFVQAFVGVMLAAMLKDGAANIEWVTVLTGALFAGGISTGKVIVAQQFGNRSSGDAIPGGIKE